MAQVVPSTEAEGPGARFALWVQGCSLRCPGCCNPEMFAERGGTLEEAHALATRIVATPGLEGLSVLGGEPFEQPAPLAQLCEEVRAHGLSVMVFTGYTLEELRALAPGRPGVNELLAQVDLLVDGRYEQAQPDTSRRWVGSRNQRLHFLTPRYVASDPRFGSGNTVELRLENGRLVVNGWPGLADALKRR